MVDWLSPKENRREVNEVGEAGGRGCIGGAPADQTALSNYPSTSHWREKEGRGCEVSDARKKSGALYSGLPCSSSVTLGLIHS